MTLVVNDLPERIDLLKRGSAHLVIVPPEFVVKEVDSKLLRPEKYILVGSPKWKGKSVKKILNESRIIDFDETDTASFDYLRHFGLLEIVSKERHFVNNNESLIKMFSKGLGYGVLTQEVAKYPLDSGDLRR